uniref:Uncharacterized protein n=1 Tax=Cyanothece sp. (strain PCC 7425 / ATCC 29141) TaxID=395961 RepID=B8HYV6_CYAP4
METPHRWGLVISTQQSPYLLGKSIEWKLLTLPTSGLHFLKSLLVREIN